MRLGRFLSSLTSLNIAVGAHSNRKNLILRRLRLTFESSRSEKTPGRRLLCVIPSSKRDNTMSLPVKGISIVRTRPRSICTMKSATEVRPAFFFLGHYRVKRFSLFHKPMIGSLIHARCSNRSIHYNIMCKSILSSVYKDIFYYYLTY